MSRRAMKRLLSLRTVEEERAEAEVSRQRRLRQLCLDRLQASEQRSAAALRTLFAALHSGDREAAISAEMALAFGPLERHGLVRQIMHLNPIVEEAASAWRSARICRLQIQTIADAAETRLQREKEISEQKALDARFLSDQIQRNSNESFQRMDDSATGISGPARAGRPKE